MHDQSTGAPVQNLWAQRALSAVASLTLVGGVAAAVAVPASGTATAAAAHLPAVSALPIVVPTPSVAVAAGPHAASPQKAAASIAAPATAAPTTGASVVAPRAVASSAPVATPAPHAVATVPVPANTASPATTAAPAPKVTTAARTQPSAAALQQAIDGLKQFLPLAPSPAQVAQVGDQVCTAFDKGESYAQVLATATSTVSQIPFVSDVNGAAKYAVSQSVALYCPGYTSKLA